MASEDAEIGRRLRLARVAKGLSQQEVAEALSLSASYVSLLEAGKRPVSGGLLDRLGELFDASADELRSGVSSEQADLIDLDLKFAEIALRNGEAPVAEERFQHALGMVGGSNEAAWVTAQFGLARALEMQGALEAAIRAYEALLAMPPEAGTVGSAWLARINTALCRIYSECGDLNRAIELGEDAMDQLPPAGQGDPAANETYVALVSTLAGCYYERGDLTRAHLLAGEAINRAHVDEQPVARASAYWNAAIIAEARGETAEARRLVDRAHALYAESDNVRAIALLKLVAAWLILREPDPALANAERLLEAGLADLATSGSQVDLAYGEVELARCKMFEGDWETAVRLSETAIGRVGADAKLQGARARLTLGQALLLGGEREQAMAIFDAAADDLRSTGADRQAAEAWRELGEVHASLGRDSDAIEAYRRAADAAGVTLTTRPQPVRLDAAPRRP